MAGSPGPRIFNTPSIRARLLLALAFTGLLLTPAGFCAETGPALASVAVFSGDDVARFYRLRGETLAWNGSVMAAGQAQLVRNALANAGAEGLEAQRYRINNRGNAVEDDVAVTAALLAYMRDLAVGRPELKSLDSDVALPPRTFDAPTLLADALRENRLGAMLAGLAPRHSDYAELRRALADNTDAARRDVLVANMERWRWMPAALEPDRIVVNAATAELVLTLDGSTVLTSKVIVGKPKTPTPILRAEGAAVTVNPAWTVPHSIAVKEILPKLKRNRHYLDHEDMILIGGPAGDPHGLAIDWRRVPAGTFPYQVQQQPGAKNALGRIKLELPNRFDVYLHDTPARNLFARSARALSHGCVRVEQILPLATYALADLHAAERISEALSTSDTAHLPLARKLPVYFLYWTAFADANGAIQTVPDVYGRDARLVAAMRAPALQLAALSSACQKG